MGTITLSSLSYPSDNTQVKESKTRLHTSHTSLHSSANCTEKPAEERTIATISFKPTLLSTEAVNTLFLAVP